MDRSIIIIGAGIAGLSAGCYGRMNGYTTQLFELHSQPGGLCTSWRRGDYTMDGCIHWLVGSGPGTSFNRLWRELGAVQGRTMVNHEEFLRVEGDGKTLIVYSALDKLIRHLKRLAPSDSDIIEDLAFQAYSLSHFDPPITKPPSLMGLLDKLKMAFHVLPFLKVLRQTAKVSIQDYANRFHDPFLRQVFPLIFNLPDFPMMGVLMTLGYLHNNNAGYPMGGSLEFARAIEDRYRQLGGEIHYGSRVTKILVERNRAVGVQLEDGTEHRADLVISAADGHATLFDMLGGRYMTREIKGYYDSLPIFKPVIQVSLGVNRDMSQEPHFILRLLKEPIIIAGEPHHAIPMKHYCYDPTLAPEGKSVVTTMMVSDYDYWKDLSQDKERYQAEKDKVAGLIIDQFENRFPGIREQVEVVDVATPLSTERYTNNWRGSIEGWMLTTRTIDMLMSGGMNMTLPGLKGFYMAGQWVEPGGGLPPAAWSGRKVIQLICRKDRKRFHASAPL